MEKIYETKRSAVERTQDEGNLEGYGKKNIPQAQSQDLVDLS